MVYLSKKQHAGITIGKFPFCQFQSISANYSAFRQFVCGVPLSTRTQSSIRTVLLYADNCWYLLMGERFAVMQHSPQFAEIKPLENWLPPRLYCSNFVLLKVKVFLSSSHSVHSGGVIVKKQLRAKASRTQRSFTHYGRRTRLD